MTFNASLFSVMNRGGLMKPIVRPNILKLMMINNIFKVLLSSLLLVAAVTIDAYGQGENRLIRKGNRAFDKGDFEAAEVEYQRSLERNRQNAIAEFNLGGAIHQQENFEESAAIFDQLSRRNLPDDKRAMSFHNLGNSLLYQQQFEQAIEAYKNALRINPDDMDTKYNLLYAQQMLQEQEQSEQQQDQTQDDQQDQQDQDDQQQQQDQAQDQQQDDQQQQDQQAEQQGQKQQQDASQQQAQTQPRQISREDAERMLQALQDRERQTLERLKEQEFKNAERVRTEKDW